MRKIWFIIMFASLIILCFTDPENSVNAMMKAGENAVVLSIKLMGIYAIWLGILGIVDETKLSDKIASLLSPVIDFLFGRDIDATTKNYLAMNLSTNILGMGNACTPLGIKAMQGLDKLNPSTTASTAMIMLLVVNATSIQILPTTIIGLRVAYGSTTSSDIIVPSIIATTLTTILGIMLVKLFAKVKFKDKNKSKGSNNFLNKTSNLITKKKKSFAEFFHIKKGTEQSKIPSTLSIKKVNKSQQKKSLNPLYNNKNIRTKMLPTKNEQRREF